MKNGELVRRVKTGDGYPLYVMHNGNQLKVKDYGAKYELENESATGFVNNELTLKDVTNHDEY